jgi:uncharacterized OB-fold protein
MSRGEARMKFETTRCFRCGTTMLMHAAICPSCGANQKTSPRANPFQPRVMIAVGLSAAVLLAWNWIKA